ncbi:hypothetical protein ACP70R_043070 [Stipagrostis hirtigluma subsp. patula]
MRRLRCPDFIPRDIGGAASSGFSFHHSEYLLNLEIAKLAQLHSSMDNLPEELLVEIIKRLTRTSDLSSFSLVSKRFYTVDGGHRDAIRVSSGLWSVTLALESLCSRFPNLCKVEFDYSGVMTSHGMQLDNHGLRHASRRLTTLRLNTLPAITSSGLLSVAVGCKSLSALQLTNCNEVGSVEWLEYLGILGSLEELVVKNCKRISQFDLLKFGQGWVKLQKFEFQRKGWSNITDPRDPSYVAHNQYGYYFSCENLKYLTLARITTEKEIGLRCLLRKCKALTNVCLHYVYGLKDADMITLTHSCSNLRSISLRLTPQFNEGSVFRTSLTDDSLKALALRCPMLQSFELIFWACDSSWPEIGFTQEGLVMLIQSCPIRDLVLSGANIFDDVGMKALSSAQFLETLELTDCIEITDAGMCLLACCPSLVNLTLRQCDGFTDAGVTKVARARNLESLIVEGCYRVSQEAVQGLAKSVRYDDGYPGLFRLDRV